MVQFLGNRKDLMKLEALPWEQRLCVMARGYRQLERRNRVALSGDIGAALDLAEAEAVHSLNSLSLREKSSGLVLRRYADILRSDAAVRGLFFYSRAILARVARGTVRGWPAPETN